MNYDLSQAKILLDRAADKLRSAHWCATDWVVKVHYYPPEPALPESVSMHIFKNNWFNETRQGIHFETHLSEKEFKEQTIPLMLHIFHSATIPGTKIKRIKVSQPFVDAASDTIAQWDGYVFRAGKYGTQPFTCKRKFTPETLAEVITTEFGRMCPTLGPLLDSALAAALVAKSKSK